MSAMAGSRLDLFAPISPWGARRLLFCMAAESMNMAEDEHALVFIDVRRAHLDGKDERSRPKREE